MNNTVYAQLAMLIGGSIESIEKTYLNSGDTDAVYGLRIKGTNIEIIEGEKVKVKYDQILWILSDFEGNGAGGFAIEDNK